MKTLEQTPENQPLKGIELKGMKTRSFEFSKDTYSIIVGRDVSLNTLYYITYINGRQVGVYNRLDKESKKFFLGE